jgi:hypothetical protein
VNGAELLGRAIVVRHELELLGNDREVREAPLLELRVVGVGLGEPHEMTHRPGDHVILSDKVRLLLGGLEGSRQRGREVARNGRLFGDD